MMCSTVFHNHYAPAVSPATANQKEKEEREEKGEYERREDVDLVLNWVTDAMVPALWSSSKRKGSLVLVLFFSSLQRERGEGVCIHTGQVPLPFCLMESMLESITGRCI